MADLDRPAWDQSLRQVAEDVIANQQGVGGHRIGLQLAKQLAQPAPYDLSEIELRDYRSLLPRWQEWGEVEEVCRKLAVEVLDRAGAERETDR